jgi:hypothetical protein
MVILRLSRSAVKITVSPFGVSASCRCSEVLAPPNVGTTIASRLGQLGQAEVQDLRVTVLGDHDVFRLDLAMNDAGSVRGRKCGGHLRRDRQPFIERPIPPRRQRVTQRPAADELLDDEVGGSVGADVVHRGGVRMAQRGGRAGLLLEAVAAFGIARELRRQNFQRDAAPEPRVLGFVHLTHATFAKLDQDLVRPDSRTGFERRHRRHDTALDTMSAVKFGYEEFDLTGVHTYPLANRPSKVRHEQFAKPWDPSSGFHGWVDALPDLLAAADFRAVVAAIRTAHSSGRGIVWGLGAHVIKTGLGPVLIDLMERGLVSALALNGAGLIHDFEVALCGSTSEEVEAVLAQGQFGMSEETGRHMNAAIAQGASENLGLGQAVCRYVAGERPRFGRLSLLSAAARLDIPVTVHVGIGTDITHMHPSASGEAIGATSLRDFRYFTSFVAGLEGGVYLNCGSAVMLPEVFLKAVSLVRNRGLSLDGLTTVNFDFVRMYRPETNVVRRPVAGIGRGYSITGHHEILIPLLAAALH